MAMYSFSLESFKALACRSQDGQDDVWVIRTVNLGARATVAVWRLGTKVPPGQGFIGPWTAGPYQAGAGEIGGATYTFVNLAGSSPEDQEKIVAGLSASVASAVTTAIGVMHASVEAAIRGVFGGLGELLAAPAVPAGAADCRGLIGVDIQPFVASDEPTQEVLETGAPVTLNGSAPATCGSGPQGTSPQSTAVFSLRRAPNIFSQSTPVTVLASTPAMMEVFAVGMDGLVRYNQRSGGASFGAWLQASEQTFSQSAPLVALAGMPQRKDVFGTGTNGVIYRWAWTQAAGWSEWTAVSAPGQFLPDTPVSAISLSGVLSLFAVDPDGVAQSRTWKDETVVSPWAPIPNMVFARRTPLLVMSHVDPWVEVFAVDPLGRDYHTSRPNNPPAAWGAWQAMASSAIEPASRRYVGLTFNVYAGVNVWKSVGMTWFRVDGNGTVNQLGWTGEPGLGWFARAVLPGMHTIPAGFVSGIRLGDSAILFMVDAVSGQIGVASRGTPVPYNGPPAWSGWSLLPVGPVLAKERAITVVTADNVGAELFVVDQKGLIWRSASRGATPWAWSVV